MKANFGCGFDKRQGYLNIDVRRNVKPELIYDLEWGYLPFKDSCMDEILLKDVLEHISFNRVEKVLSECKRILKPNGRLYIQCPDLEAIAKKYILNPNRNGDFKVLSFFLYGKQDYPENYHKSGFIIKALQTLLLKLNFKIEEIGNDGETNIICWSRKM